MPRLSDTMEEGVIVEWLKKVGEKVEPGDILAEVETDKATMELESFNEGYLLHIGVQEGTVPVDGVIAVIGEKDEDFKAALDAAEADASASSSNNGQEDTQPESDSGEASGEPEAATAVTAEATTDSGTRVKASPLAKAMAQDAGVDLRTVSGSGDNGRIVKRDVEALLAGGAPQAAKAAPAPPQFGEVPVSQMRKTIARRLAESKFGAPHFYLTLEIDMSQAVSDRKMLNEDEEVRVSFNDLVVKACALALKEHPAINSSWQETTIRRNKDVNIGIAVAVEDGLLVPVVRDADTKGLRQLHTEIVDYATKAQSKKLQPEEMQGNTFTISNLGMFGIEEFTAIINPPDSCILAVGAITQKPIVKNGEIAVGHMMKVTMSCDHRVVDGATGAKFLQTVKGYLESPVRMLG